MLTKIKHINPLQIFFLSMYSIPQLSKVSKVKTTLVKEISRVYTIIGVHKVYICQEKVGRWAGSFL